MEGVCKPWGIQGMPPPHTPEQLIDFWCCLVHSDEQVFVIICLHMWSIYNEMLWGKVAEYSAMFLAAGAHGTLIMDA